MFCVINSGTDVFIGCLRHFRIRFTPEVPGVWTWKLHGCTVAGVTEGSFVAVSTGRRSFVRVANNGQFFSAGDVPIFLLGQDIVFPGRDPILTTYNCQSACPHIRGP